MAQGFAFPSPRDDIYDKLTVAGAVLIASIEIAYILLSNTPSFFLPSVEAPGQPVFGRDFLNVWMGGWSALEQGPAAWFDRHAYNLHLRELLGQPELYVYYWSYPPHVLPLIWPFGLLPYLAAFVVWTGLGFALFVAALRAGGLSGKHLVFAAVAPAVALNLFFGQNGFYTAALIVTGLVNLDRRPWLSGALFGILTVKPQLGFLLPLMLLLTGRWRVIVSAALTAALLVAATTALYGVEIWTAFIAETLPQQAYFLSFGDHLLYLLVPSLLYGARIMGLPLEVAWTIQLLGSATAVAIVIWTYWRRRDPELSVAVLLTATILVAPYTLSYDMVVLGWMLALLRRREDNEPIDDRFIIALWVLPLLMLTAGALKCPVGPVVLCAFLARLLIRLARQEARAGASAPLGFANREDALARLHSPVAAAAEFATPFDAGEHCRPSPAQADDFPSIIHLPR